MSNPFPYPSALEKVLLREMVKVASRCYLRGWSYGTAGNFSVRGKKNIVWQSPTGYCKGELNSTQFIPVDLDSAQAIGSGRGNPSGEMPVHLGIYRTIAEAKVVVHAHPPGVVERSRDLSTLTFRGEEMQKHLGCGDHSEVLKIPVVPNPLVSEMPSMVHALQESLNPRVPLVAFSAHGVYAWGESPMQALSFMEAAEFLCQSCRP